MFRKFSKQSDFNLPYSSELEFSRRNLLWGVPVGGSPTRGYPACTDTATQRKNNIEDVSMNVLQDLLGAKWTADNGSRYTARTTQTHRHACGYTLAHTCVRRHMENKMYRASHRSNKCGLYDPEHR